MKSKIEKLVELVGSYVRVVDLKRLDDGELAHVGDAIIAGKKITRDGKVTPLADCIFNGVASRYAVQQETRSLNGYEYPAPETEAPEVGTRYYVPDLVYGACAGTKWQDDPRDKARLKAGVVHLSEKNAIAHRNAIILAGGGEAWVS